MTRYALVDASEGTAAAVRAALGADSVATCPADAISSDTALAIVVCPPGRRRLDPASLGLLPPPFPVLFLGDSTRIPLDAFADRPTAVLKKTFEVSELRQTVRALLSRVVEPSTVESPPGLPWLDFPRVQADSAQLLAGATRLGAVVWIVGEVGTGTEDVAAALARRWDPDGPPVAWQEEEPLALALSRLTRHRQVLWVPRPESRSQQGQRELERALALDPQRRVVVTSEDRVEDALSSGDLLPALHHRLSRVSVRLAPLRQRRRDIVELALTFGREVAARALNAERFDLSRSARRLLESYPWSGNLAELEAVMTRSVLDATAAAVSELELGVADLRFVPSHLAVHDEDDDSDEEQQPRFEGDADASDSNAAPAVAAAAARRVVVLPLAARTSPRSVTALNDSLASQRRADGSEDDKPAAGSAMEVESLLAVFAHDIRNPLSTLKTFAALQAADAGEEEAELASLAMAAGDRLDEQLGLLQRYSELSREPAEGRPVPAELDLVDVLGEALEAADPTGQCLEIAARRSLPAAIEATLARFVADAIVAECLDRNGPGKSSASDAEPSGDEGLRAIADLASAPGHGGFLEIRIPLGTAAVDRLDRWVEGMGLPWRIALARDAARRSGGDLQVDVVDGQMRLSWRLPAQTMEAEEAEEEEGTHDKQTGSPDRRRRSRSS